MKIKLKPCPFCGKKGQIISEFDKEFGNCWVVRCENCYANASSIVESMDELKPEEKLSAIMKAVNEAVNSWNKRIKQEETDADDDGGTESRTDEHC